MFSCHSIVFRAITFNGCITFQFGTLTSNTQLSFLNPKRFCSLFIPRKTSESSRGAQVTQPKAFGSRKNIPGKGEEKVSGNWDNSKTERLKEEGRTDKGRVGGNKGKQEEKRRRKMT